MNLVLRKFTAMIPLGIVLCCLATPSSAQSKSKVEVISIGYHSDHCEECNELKSKMKRMNRKFAFSSIIFIKYDKTSEKTKRKAEKKLLEWGMLEIARRDDGLKYVILYDATTKEKIVRLGAEDSVEELERKISSTLKK